MFLAFKVGSAAFKVGKIAANTGKALKALQNDVKLWEIQINYYSDFYNLVRDKIPPSLYVLCIARTRVVISYVENLKVKIAQAQVGTKKVQMKLVAKASGEIGTSFVQDMEVFFAFLEESYQMCMHHITLHQMDKVDKVLKHLQATSNAVGVKDEAQFISNALEITVQSRRLIFILESPQKKVASGSKVKLVWTTAGNIPFVNIEIQVSSIIQQAQDKAKKSYITIAEKIETSKDAIGQYEWEVPRDFVKNYGKHGNYHFKVSYKPTQTQESKELKEEAKTDFIGTSLVGKTANFESKVKSSSDTFKIFDPSVPKVEAAPDTKATSSPTTTSEKVADVKSSVTKSTTAAFGKATNFMKRK